jgi:hypothetical protein
MHSSRVRHLFVAMIAVFALSAVASSSASAACYRVDEAKTGTFEDSSCMVANGTKEYIKVSKLETELAPGEWCAKVEAAKTGSFEDSKCAKGLKEGAFAKVLVPPAAPATNCPITSEGVSFKETVTKSNEKELREAVINSTWGPEGKKGECTAVSEFNADVTGGKITAKQKEEYKTFIAEVVVPGSHIWSFKWHVTGGTSFTTLGVTTVGVGAREFEPIGLWDDQTNSEIQHGTEVVEEKEALVDISETWNIHYPDPLLPSLFSLARGTVKLKISTPDRVKITPSSQEVLFTYENLDIGVNFKLEEVSFRILGTNPECYEPLVREKISYYFGLREKVEETRYQLCANGMRGPL